MIFTEKNRYNRETFLKDVGAYSNFLKLNHVNKGDRVSNHLHGYNNIRKKCGNMDFKKREFVY